MADRIMGGEPYADRFERATSLRNQWPEGDARCVAVGDEFYANGDGMRREGLRMVCTPIDPDSGEYYSCDVYNCRAVLCEYCGGDEFLGVSQGTP